MQLLYVDRVEFIRRTVARQVPAHRGWTTEHLLERQKAELKHKGFGKGYVIDERLEIPPTVDIPVRQELPTCEVSSARQGY